MRATLIWNDKWTPVILAGRAAEAASPTVNTACVPMSLHQLSPHVTYGGNTRAHIIRQACAADSPRASRLVSSLARDMKFATSSRICAGKAPTCRVNVNVLTRLPKIRAVPAPIRPLNSTPVYSPHQARSSVHLCTVGCWGFDVGEGSNGIKDPILCPFFSPLFPIPGSSI